MATSQISFVIELIKQQAQMIERVERGNETRPENVNVLRCVKY